MRTITSVTEAARLRGLRPIPTVAVLLVVASVAYRVLIMDGLLAGFTDDDFVHQSRAQQIVLGELPVRDFAEIGMPLTETASAVAQAAFGRNLLSEFLLAGTLLGGAVALLFVLGARAAGSVAIALVPALLLIVLEPRLYNYPKLLTYALAIPVLWRYLDRPTPGRAAAAGGVVALAFLFRHDHGVYIGAAAAVTLLAAHWARPRDLARAAAVLGMVMLAGVAPYLVFVQAHQGVVEYLQAGMDWAERDAARTARGPQRIEIDWSAPLVAVAPEPRPIVDVRWAEDVAPNERARVEQRHALQAVEERSPGLIRYELSDWSRPGLEALVGEPAVADTHGIDRRRLLIDDPEFDRASGVLERIQVLPGLLAVRNAVPFLFFLLSAVPFLALGLVLARWKDTGDPLGDRWQAKVLVVVVLALLVNAGFLRGALASRLPDVMLPAGVLAAWLAGRSWRMEWRAARMTALTLVAVLGALSFASAATLREIPRRLEANGAIFSPSVLRDHLAGVRVRLLAEPPVAAYAPDPPGSLRLADYLHACTRPDDRVLLLAYAPELPVFAARGFAGGLHAIQPGFFESPQDQRLILARVATRRVPIAVSVPAREYEEDYRPAFPLIDRFVAENYRPIVEAGSSEGLPFRVLARRDLVPTGTYEPLNLPCYQ